VAWIEAQHADEALDGGTRGLGEEVLSTRAGSQETPIPSSAAITKKVTEQPLPGQRRHPCPRNVEVVINGGCWYKVDIKPPCGDYYEWQSACYLPVIRRTHVPTTQEP
jgi:hypothetical protein